MFKINNARINRVSKVNSFGSNKNYSYKPLGRLGIPANSNRKTHKLRNFVIFILFILSVLITIFFVVFVTKDVVVVESNNIQIYSKAVGDISQKFMGKNIVMISDLDVSNYITSNIPDYKFIKLEKIYPWQLKVYIIKREQKYLIKANNGIFELDKDFIPIQKKSDDQNPRVTYMSDIFVGQKIEDPLLVAAVKYGDIGIDVIVDGPLITTKYEEDTLVLLPSDNINETDNLVELLKKIIQKYRIENKKVKLIDLRYSKPLIQFE